MCVPFSFLNEILIIYLEDVTALLFRTISNPAILSPIKWMEELALLYADWNGRLDGEKLLCKREGMMAG